MYSSLATKQLTLPSPFSRVNQSIGVEVDGEWPMMPKLNSMPPESHGPRRAMSRNFITWFA